MEMRFEQGNDTFENSTQELIKETIISELKEFSENNNTGKVTIPTKEI